MLIALICAKDNLQSGALWANLKSEIALVRRSVRLWLHAQRRDLTAARLYDSKEAVVQDALRHLLRARPDLRINLAIHRYQNELISLAQAASETGVSWVQMREILIERGVQPWLGPETLEEAERNIEALREQGVSQ